MTLPTWHVGETGAQLDLNDLRDRCDYKEYISKAFVIFSIFYQSKEIIAWKMLSKGIRDQVLHNMEIVLFQNIRIFI